MNNTSPFSFLASIATRFPPPAWMVNEGQQRLVLFLNHVLLQEKQAQERLVRQKGRVVHLRWGLFAMDLIVTPAGLADRAPALSKPDLVLSVVAESPLAVAQSVLAGKTPTVKIEGDVQLAAEIGWLAENLRWDAEEDLSRLVGDAPAHAVADAGRRLSLGLKQFLAKLSMMPGGQTAASGAASSATPAAASTAERSAAYAAPAFQAPQGSSILKSVVEEPFDAGSKTDAGAPASLVAVPDAAATGTPLPDPPGTAA